MIVLSTFLESLLNFLSNNLKIVKIKYSQGENWCQTLNCQKHSLKGQSRTKSPGKPIWSENDCSKHIFGILIKFSIQQPEKTLQNLVQAVKKAVSKIELAETQLERTLRYKIT